MLANTYARALAIGLIPVLLFAIFLHFAQTAVEHAPGPAPSPFSFDDMGAALRNSLQIAQRAVCRGGYKSARSAQVVSHPPPIASSISTSTFRPTLSSASTASKAFSTSTANMASTKPFLDAVKDRRTFYQLNKEAPISDKRIVEIVNTLATHVPSSFNSQSTRLVVLLNGDHDTFWDFVRDVLKPMVPEDSWGATEKKVAGFQAAKGTILFFEDPEPVEDLTKKFPIYAHHFGDWSEHTSAMHQFALWVALEAEGCGANLQHYNPIVDQKVQEHFKIPMAWKLRAQLVFGGRAGEPRQKTFEPLEKRVFVHGAKQ